MDSDSPLRGQAESSSVLMARFAIRALQRLHRKDPTDVSPWSFSGDGDLMKSFGQAPTYYRAPDESYVLDEKKFPSLEKLKDELYRLMASWTRPVRLEIISPGTILVQSAANGLVEGCSKKHVIDLWSTQGDLIAEAIPCDYQFLCSDRKGNCYFLISTNQEEALDKDPMYAIGKYRLALPELDR